MSDIKEALEALQADFNKQFGKSAMTRLSSPKAISNVQDWVSSRSMVVDSVLRGGRPPGSSLVPFGREMEISGLEGCGKTTLCAQIAAETQAQGGVVIVTDTEEKIDAPYWASLGVDTEKILKITCNSVEEVFNEQYWALQNLPEYFGDKKVLMIWDSLGGTSIGELVDPKSKETPMEQVAQAYGRSAGEISKGIRLIHSIVAKRKACYLYTNHLYGKMNTMGYGDPWETYGGQKIKYLATVRLRLQRVGSIKEDDAASTGKSVTGLRVKVKALKNHMAPHELEREAILIGGRGFVNEYTVFDAGARLGVITKKGAWSTWKTPAGDEVKFQGFNGFEEKVVTHPEYPELYKEVEALL